ncbi:secretion protein HlyD [Sphingopyxis sp. H115]|nr:secretion protein HlyD [Sphingopyxis sp. H115]
MFRHQALSRRIDRLSGDVAIAVPISWQSIGYLLFVGVAVAVAFLSLASYSRVETVAGTITPDKGVATILPTRGGVIASLSVRDGQTVEAGTELASIRAEEDSASGVSTAAQIAAAVDNQDTSLAAQMTAAYAASDAQLRQLAAQRSGLTAEISQLQSQIGLQRDLIESAQKDYDRASTIAARGFISQRDLQVREETLLARRQGLSQLTQSLAAKHSAVAEAERSAAQVSAQARAQHASLAASRAEVAQQAASTAGSRAYVLRAPVAGKVTALTARIGQPVSTQTPLMTIVPAGSVLRAELAVPSAAIGFVKPGQTVRLSVDAFPYQRFGTVTGKILTVATSSIGTAGPNGTTIPVYPVMVALDEAAVSAFGRDQPLVPGMTLTGRIVTEKQSVLTWLFEPLFAVQRR